jgi:hypothetical protein
MKYKGVVLFKYYQTIELEAESRESAEQAMYAAFDQSKAEAQCELYDMEELPRELTADEKAFAKAVEWNGGYENEAVLAFILSNGDDSFSNGKWGEYYSSLTDLSNVFWDALTYARRQK